MKKAEALNAIRYEVATYGEITNKAMRLYVENRISKTIFNAFVEQGFRYYRLKKNNCS